MKNTENMLATINSATAQQIGVMLQNNSTLVHRMVPLIMKQYHVGENGYTFLLDEDGTILYHPNRNLVMRGWNDLVPEREGLKKLLDGIALIELNGQKQYIIVTRLPLTGWYVASALPEFEVLDQLRALSRTSLLSNLGAGIILLLLVTFLLNYMLKYIPIIIKQLHRIAEGQLTEFQMVPSHDEFGQISLAIREMAHKIQASIKLIHESAFYDALTGLPNRRFLDEKLTQALQDAKRLNGNFALIFIDLDNFKWINDTRGHKFGDELLRQICSRLIGIHRDGDMMFRFGGDEFVILLQHIGSKQELEHYVERLRTAFSSQVNLFSHSYYINFSAGVVMFPDDGATEEELLKNSDMAMYHAKALGKNRIQYFSSDMISTLLEKEKLTQELRNAVLNQSMTLQYQAIVDAQTSRLYGFEALLRWSHPELGPISPDQFIPLAEEVGLIVPLGEWVLREACRACRLLQDEYQPMSVSVNVSVLQLRSPSLIDAVKHALHESGIDPKHLVLEITEGIVIENFEQSVEALRQLRAIGVRLALDDFGTGYSSLGYLKKLPIDILKLDKVFIWDLDIQSSNSKQIVGPIIDLAHNLGLNIVAEGVETKDQAEMLRAWGCDLNQGYWYSKPVSFEEIKNLLQRF
ncbi:EAL domain-containing protein [Cohnella sp. CFH 77786]|uniref:bifunctional diguanylate cyclase/phosphodiesterase n=1 Tax=Cohnella sp. CFH 77786 TaxID=2662265 RepID=UPI001C608267|nr:EAL domain-containing protein [Cohnella sp. CFH 77786]MBW5447338.1 EAL domain-containing protein [Cohnella sp. CFH 77786]